MRVMLFLSALCIAIPLLNAWLTDRRWLLEANAR